MNIDPDSNVPPKDHVTDRDAPGSPSTAGRVIAYVDGLLVPTIAAVGLPVLLRILRDPDALVRAQVSALGFYASSALLFGIAALSMWRRWEARWLVQAVAILWAYVSFSLLFGIGETLGPVAVPDTGRA
jgi:hypothetical protein